jgi:hypothetical protein
MISSTLLLILSFLLFDSASSSSSICPESPVSVFARCEMTVSFHQTCRQVQSEIRARLTSNNKKWIDPHNHGTYYSLEFSNSSRIEASHLTGNGLYTDKLALEFVVVDNSAGGCTLRACSTSQVTSIVDYSTNYCNLYNLYTGEGLKHELTIIHHGGGETYPDCWQRKLHRCHETYDQH